MYIGWNELALFGHIAQVIVFIGLLGLTIRDLQRGENGTTPGLFVLTAGMLITNSLIIFVTATSHPLSPHGFIPLRWSSETYDLVGDLWNALAAWGVAIGAWMLAIYVYKLSQKK